MGTLYLVRHGQASFGAADYDQLSELGARQCRRLGDYFKAREQRFDAVITGTLKRHVQSWQAIADGLQADAQPLAMPGLNEYDSAAVIRAVHPEPLSAPKSAEEYRGHFRLLREGLKRWMAGDTRPEGMPSFQAFSDGITEALDHVRTRHDGDVLIVSSGGPISTAVSLVLGTAPEVMIDLNMRLRNSAVTEFTVTPKRHLLTSFNTLPHLHGVADADWITYT